MSAWRRKAIELLPEQRRLIESTDTCSYLWTELGFVFSEAAESENIDLLRRMFAYAKWCWKESRTDDSINGVLCGFYEDVSGRKTQWWTVARFVESSDFRELESVFRYFLNEEQYKEFAEFYTRERQRHEEGVLVKMRKRQIAR